MKTVLKIIGVLVVIGALLTAVLAVAIKIFLTPEKAKALLQTQVAERLHREMKLGSVEVGLFSGLAVTDFSLSERPNFAAGTFVSTERFVIRPRLLPLLAKQFLIHDVALIKPAITVIRNADGTFNFSDLTGASATPAMPATPAPAAAAPAASGTSPLTFVVSSAQIDEGHLTFVDHSTAAMSAEVRALNLRVKNFTLSGPMDLTTDMTVATKNLEAAVVFQGVINPFNGTARIKKAQITSGSSSVSAAGEATELLGAAPKLDLTLTLVDIEPARFASLVPLPSGTVLGGSFSADITVKGTANDVSFVLTSNAAPLKIGFGANFRKPAGVPFSLTSNGEFTNKKDLSLAEAKITLSSMTVTAKGTITDLPSENRRIALSVASSNLSVPMLARFVPAAALPTGVEINGPLAVTADIKGTANAGTLAFTGGADNAGVHYADDFNKPAGTPLSLTAEGSFTAAPSFETQALRVTVGGMILEGPVSFRSGANGASYTAALKSNTFPLESVALMAPAAADYAPAGPAEITVHAKSAADGPAVSGSVSLKGVSAKYQRSDLTQLTGSADFTMDSVNVPGLKGKFNGSDLSLKVSGRNFSTHPVIAATIDVGELDINRLLPTAAKHADAAPYRDWQWVDLLPTEMARAAEPMVAGSGFMDRPMDLSGSLAVGSIKHDDYTAKDLKLTWNVTGVTAALTKINGVATLKQGAGNVKNIQALMSDSKTAKVLLVPLGILQKIDKASGGSLGLPPLDPFAFKSLSGDYKFKSGVMEITAFDMDSDTLSTTITGTAGLSGAMPLDMKMVVKLAGGLGSAMGQVLGGDSQGRATLNITVKGTTLDPKPSLDKQATTNQLINAAKGIFGKNLLGNSGAPAQNNSSNGAATSAAPAAPASNNEPAQQIQNLLKGLFKK